MTDPTVLATLATNVKVAFDVGKAILAAKEQMNTAELKLRLADMMSALAEAKVHVAEAQDELRAQDHKISELEAAFRKKGDVTRDHDAYYEKGADGLSTGEPYCMVCWERDHKLFGLHRLPGNSNTHACATCRTTYEWRRTAPASQYRPAEG